MVLDFTIREFARKLAAREPAPGGGAAASYTGALGAAVAGMAVAYSIRKDEEDRARIAELAEGLDYLERLREDLLLFTKKDSEAYGAYSFAAGRRAKADHDGAFVWGDSFDADKTSSAPDEFNVYASGGVRMWTDSAATLGAALLPDATAWSVLSDRAS